MTDINEKAAKLRRQFNELGAMNLSGNLEAIVYSIRELLRSVARIEERLEALEKAQPSPPEVCGEVLVQQ